MELSKNKRIMLGVFGVCALIFAFIFGKYADLTDFDFFADAKETAVKKNVSAEEANKIFSDDLIVGADPKTAKVKIFEFASFTCPHCAQFQQETGKKLKEKFKDSKHVSFIYRDFPLDGAALLGAQLANCDPAKRAGFTDLLYAKQAEWTAAKTPQALTDFLISYAKAGGLPKEKALACLTSEEIKTKILEKQQHADKVFTITGTPSIFVNGVSVTPQSEPVNKAVREALQAAGVKE